jgi:hypothetical protein
VPLYLQTPQRDLLHYPLLASNPNPSPACRHPVPLSLSCSPPPPSLSFFALYVPPPPLPFSLSACLCRPSRPPPAPADPDPVRGMARTEGGAGTQWPLTPSPAPRRHSLPFCSASLAPPLLFSLSFYLHRVEGAGDGRDSVAWANAG